jgi:hypothetical protein
VIAKAIGKSEAFVGRLNYIAQAGKAVVFTENLTSRETARQEMAATAAMSRRVKDPCYHFVLTMAELENPTDEQFHEAAKIALAELDLADHQAVIAIHRDRDHQHVHIVVNRVNPVTHKANVLSHDYAKLEKACREIEMRQQWSQDRGRFEPIIEIDANGNEDIKLVPKPNDRTRSLEQARPATAAELGRERRTGHAPLAEIGGHIAQAIKQAKSWDELHAQLTPLGVAYERKGSGAVIRSMSDETEVLKASTVDRGAAIGQLEKRLGAFVERPATPIQPPLPPALKEQARAFVRTQNARTHPEHQKPPVSLNALRNLRQLDHLSDARGQHLLRPHARDRVRPERAADQGMQPVSGRERDAGRGIRSTRDPGPEYAAKRDRARSEKRAADNPLWAEFETFKDTKYQRRRDIQKQAFEARLAMEKRRRDSLYQRHREERSKVFNSLPRGIIRGVILWFVERRQKAERAALQVTLKEQRAASRVEQSRQPAITWKGWLELKAAEGRQDAISAMRGAKPRGRKDDPPAARKSGAPATSAIDREAELAALRKLDLPTVAERLGYVAEKTKPGAQSVKMRRDSEVIVVRRDPAGGDRWFSTADNRANGDLFRLVQHVRGGGFSDAREFLRPLLRSVPAMPALERGDRPLADVAQADHTDVRQAWMGAKPGMAAFLANRGITSATANRYAEEIRIDQRGNAIFAHRNDLGDVIGFEVKNQGYAGFAKGGRKSLARFGPRDASRIFVAESGLDAISAAQLEGHRRDTLYVSTGGAPGRRTLDELVKISRSKILAVGMDNDPRGHELAEQIREATQDTAATVERLPPEAKDWNDQLQAAALAEGVRSARTIHAAEIAPGRRRRSDQSID